MDHKALPPVVRTSWFRAAHGDVYMSPAGGRGEAMRTSFGHHFDDGFVTGLLRMGSDNLSTIHFLRLILSSSF